MMNFDWTGTASTLQDFGGEEITLHVPKTGLPFFDTLCLYGAIDLYIGLREDVYVHDNGNEWEIRGRVRPVRIADKDIKAFNKIKKSKKKTVSENYCRKLRKTLLNGEVMDKDIFIPANRALIHLDAALQAGIRDTAASEYEMLQTGQTNDKAYPKILLSYGLMAYAGKKRTEQLGNITFLPIFEGQINLSKVVSPIRARMGIPNVICAQSLALLVLKTSLFVEGYQERLISATFNTTLGGKRSDNYSGLVTIESTAIGKMTSSDFVGHVYSIFKRIIGDAWSRRGKSYQSNAMTSDALTMAYWLMQPVQKHLSSMITSQERLYKQHYQHIFTKSEYVKEVFEMSYGKWHGNHEAVRKLAKAVASGIYYARMKDKDDPNKEWYDEVTLLRSAPTAKAFIERAMILVEQGHRAYFLVGTAHIEEAFDPSELFASIGENRNDFETFRDLFRMYLVQESTYHERKHATSTNNEEEVDREEMEPEKEEEQ